MTDEERSAPDSLRGKLRDLLGDDETDDRPVEDADEPELVEPKLPTDPPF